jgi:hypothetical protein
MVVMKTTMAGFLSIRWGKWEEYIGFSPFVEGNGPS